MLKCLINVVFGNLYIGYNYLYVFEGSFMRKEGLILGCVFLCAFLLAFCVSCESIDPPHPDRALTFNEKVSLLPPSSDYVDAPIAVITEDGRTSIHSIPLNVSYSISFVNSVEQMKLF